MALVLPDRVKETTTTTGTGTVTLGGAATGYQSFAAVGNGNTTYYTIAGQGTNEWEVGIGTYTASGTTLSRDTIFASSNSGSAVNFSAGTKDVFVTYPAERGVWGSGTVLVAPTGAILPIANGGTNSNATPTAGAVPYGTGSAFAFSAAGSAAQVLLSGGTGAPTWSNQSALSVGTATNVAGGAANQIPYQTGSGATGFITAPSVANTYLSWNGSAFTWASVTSWPAIVTPTNTSPANGATNQTYNITLTASAYYDLYGYAQAGSQWQVSTSSGFGTTIVNTGDIANTTSYVITASAGLSTSTTYYWRVRYKNSNGDYSSWSSPTSFVTAASFAYSVDYLIVAGGGGGDASRVDAGGAGAGGYVSGTTSMNPGTVYTCTVGGGGTGGFQGGYGAGTNGSNSSISGLGLTTAIGGGRSYATGGSGGAQASGTAGQGNAGGSDNTWAGGGGGGAGAAGSSAGNKSPTGYGGNGSTWSDGVTYAGGGGGGNYVNGYAVPGGTGGGGYGGPRASGGNGTNGLGGGGGGGAAPYAYGYYGGNGGSGIVIIRYAGAQRGSGGTVTSAGGYTYHTFTSTGNYTG